MRVKANLVIWPLCMLFLLIVVSTAYAHNGSITEPYSPPKIIYVDDDATCTCVGDGLSWGNAFRYLQDALGVAQDGDEIRVAQGFYKPDQGALVSGGKQGESFHIAGGITLKGGYSGLSAVDSDERNIEEYQTILSGDLSCNDACILDPNGFFDQPTFAENSYNVVTIEGTDATVILDGFVITAGRGRTGGSPRGGHGSYIPGGFLISSASPIISNCVFTHNATSGVYVDSGDPVFSNCVFTHNASSGVYVNSGSPAFIDCEFTKNWASQIGGGINCLSEDQVKLIRCEFIGNFAKDEGGGLYNSGSDLSLVDCTFAGNSATSGGALYGNVDFLENCAFTGNSAEYGGALYRIEDAIIEKCIFTGNRADNGGVLVGGGSVNLESCTFTGNLAQNGNVFASLRARDGTPGLEMTVVNSILWEGDNEFEEFNISITHSNIQGGWPGGGNIDVDPLFAAPGYWIDVNDPNMIVETDNPNFVLIDGHYYLNYPRYRGEPTNIPIWIDGDYHLKSQAGRYDPNSKSWVVDDVTSLCIDAGYPVWPVEYEPFPNGGIVNMGAYSGTAEASKSYFGEPVCQTNMAGDINGDCKVDFQDILIIALQWTDGVPPLDGELAVVKIVEPENGAIFQASPEPVLIRAEVNYPAISISEMTFYIEKEHYGGSSHFSYEVQEGPYDWELLWDYNELMVRSVVGQYFIWAEAIDELGTLFVSPEVKITIE